MKHLLLIGNHSYIGKNLIRYCEKHKKSEIQITAVSGKEKEYETMDFHQFDAVLLLSGIVHVKAETRRYDEVNFQMPVQIAKKAKREGIKQFIFASTIAVYGNAQNTINHKTPTSPQTEYAKSKLKAENAIQKMESEEFGVTVIRPPMVYGPDCPGNFNRLVHFIDKVHMFPKYENERSAIYIENLCEFICEVIRLQKVGIYVPQNSEYLCSLEIAKAMKEEGRNVCILHGMNHVIRFFMRYNQQMSKLFGNYKYEQEGSNEEIKYQMISTKESIKKSI